MSSGDAAALAFDTGHDAVPSNGHEDQFIQGGLGGNPSNQSHWVYNVTSGVWSVQDAPYNQSLPNHAGLASAWASGRARVSARTTECTSSQFRSPCSTAVRTRPWDSSAGPSNRQGRGHRERPGPVQPLARVRVGTDPAECVWRPHSFQRHCRYNAANDRD